MSDKLVTVARFTDYMEAELAKQMLDNSDIRSVLTGVNVASVYSGVPAAMDLAIQTLESQADKAREVLQARQKQEQ